MLTARRAPWLARAATPLVCFLGLAAASLWLMRGRLILGFGQPDVFAFSVAFCMLVGGQASVRRASHAVRDDVAARPLLASLPIAPRATLRAKTALVQAYAVSFAAGPLFLAATFRAMTVTEALRLVELVIVLLVSASLAVSVAFLTQGNGAPRSASLGASTRFEQTLVLVPLFGVMFDEGRLNHAFAALSLVLLTLEARRAAAKSVRWTDDDDAQVAKQTPVWRALLVFGAFFPIQLVIQALSVVIFDESRREWRAVLAYASSGVVLALLTFRARSDQPSLPFAPKRAWWLAIGALSGLAAHGATMLYVRFVLGTEPAADKDASLSALLATFVLVSVLAPVVEEYYFRGWLQQAITSELPRRLRAFAFVPAAFAFSAVHVGSEHLPIFVLGLVAGALAYLSRSLGPAMLAHGVYNASLLIGATCTSRGGA